MAEPRTIQYLCSMSKQKTFDLPILVDKVVLHSCCAPCSSGMIDYLLEQGIKPLVFFYNPNIFPNEEYLIRKEENKRYATALGLQFVDADNDYAEWKAKTIDLKDEPERGQRCQRCFDIRLEKTAQFAHENGYQLFATTLATSRWKDLDQIARAGDKACAIYPDVTFWKNNWRKNGLAVKQAAIIKEFDFYRQQYCGCEYSLRDSNQWRKEQGKDLVRPGESYKSND